MSCFDEDFGFKIEILAVFVKPKVVSIFLLVVFLEPKVVSKNISAVWVVIFFFSKVSRDENSCFLPNSHKARFHVKLTNENNKLFEPIFGQFHETVIMA